MSRFLILAVVAILIPVPVNLYQNKIGGRNVSLGITVLVVLVAGYLAFMIHNENDNTEGFDGHEAEDQEDQEDFEFEEDAENEDLNNNFEEEEDDVNNVEVNDNMFPVQEETSEDALEQENVQQANQVNSNVQPSLGLGNNEDYKSVQMSDTKVRVPNECYPKDILNPEELLPKDNDSLWAQTVPAGQGSIGDQNFLNAGHHIGVNTVGQTLRNANLQLRSEPPNPQVKVSPWLQTTIEPDSNRKPLEIN